MLRTLAVFARWPEPGRVKTRLCPTLGAGLACELHLAMLADTLAAARAARIERRVLSWADAADPSGAPIAHSSFEIDRQAIGDLGARLAAAFASLRLAPDDRIIVVGSDAPEITPAILDAGFAALAHHAVVVGPALDGGFYLIGLSQPIDRWLAGIAWSTADVLSQTLARAKALGLAAARIEPLPDIDTAEDLLGLLGRLLRQPERAPRSAAMLAGIGLLPPSVRGVSEPTRSRGEGPESG